MRSPKLTFSSKAGTLEDLAGVLNTARVLPLARFTHAEFRQHPEQILKAVLDLHSDKVIVRSSALDEDNADASHAGEFLSLPDIAADNPLQLIDSIAAVFTSYGQAHPDNEVFVQPMLVDTRYSGVAFSADVDTLSPYYVINYSRGPRADSVTSGQSNALQTVVHFKHAPFPPRDPVIERVILACKECERLFDNPCLDLEFAITRDGTLYLLQVRPLSRANKLCAPARPDDVLKTALHSLHTRLNEYDGGHPHLLGERAIFGVMPDWNPAEMIGLKPKALSLSLYKELITDNIWAYQRDNYGYRNLRSHPLMWSFLGVPFIDVRVCFNSFVPKHLDEKIANKLVNYYLDALATYPQYHDKVEFELVHSCFYLNLPHKLKSLLNRGFNENEIKRIEFSLLDLTNQIIDTTCGLYKQDLEKVEVLKTRYREILDSRLGPIDKIYWLLEDCKRYGTLPFAGVARAAFVAVQFLRSFKELDIITCREYDQFMNSLNTVSKRLSLDLHDMERHELSRDEFLDKYGHLRPGTYDILSATYLEGFRRYFGNLTTPDPAPGARFELSPAQLTRIDDLLRESGIETGAKELMQYITEAIEGREYAKFIFTRSLSKAIELIEKLGEQLGLSKEELAHLDIRELMRLKSNIVSADTRPLLLSNIRRNQREYRVTQAVKLPNLILEPEDIYSFALFQDEPNFVGGRSIQGRVVHEDHLDTEDLHNTIIFIRSADPGYEFLFTKSISGLVTQYGGANSHMAIRCAELGLPAVIGAGESNFNVWKKSRMLEIDAPNKQVRAIA